MSNLVPDGWTLTSIGEITNSESLFKDGDWVESKDQDPSGDNRLIQLADVGDGRFINKSSRFMNDEQFTRLKCTELKKGDVLVARMPEPLGRACIYPLNNTKAATIVDIAIIRTNNADHYWLMSAINSSDFRYHIDLNASGTTRTRIARGALSKLKLIGPPLPEQQKIAKILTSVDEVIEKTQAQIDKLKDLKTGTMQELLTNGIGHTEFKDSPVGRIPAEWEAQSIGQLLRSGIIDSIQDGNHGAIHPKSSDFTPEGIPFVMASNIHNGEIDFEKANKIPLEIYNNLRIGFSRAGDVLLSHKATVGLTAMVPESVDKLMLTPQVTYYRIAKHDVLYNWYLHYYFQSDRFQEVISIFSAQSTRSYIGILGQKDLNIAFPSSIIEQEKLVSILKGVDGKINAQKNRLNKFIDLKKSLMQDLLTGKVRVNTDLTNTEVAVG